MCYEWTAFDYIVWEDTDIMGYSVRRHNPKQMEARATLVFPQGQILPQKDTIYPPALHCSTTLNTAAFSAGHAWPIPWTDVVQCSTPPPQPL